MNKIEKITEFGNQCLMEIDLKCPLLYEGYKHFEPEFICIDNRGGKVALRGEGEHGGNVTQTQEEMLQEGGGRNPKEIAKQIVLRHWKTGQRGVDGK